jgi:type II secretory pathway component PulC
MKDISFSSARARLSEPESQAYLAGLYWYAVISIGLILAFLSAAFGAYQYVQPIEPEASGVTVPASQALNGEELSEVIKKLDARSERFRELVD